MINQNEYTFLNEIAFAEQGGSVKRVNREKTELISLYNLKLIEVEQSNNPVFLYVSLTGLGRDVLSEKSKDFEKEKVTDDGVVYVIEKNIPIPKPKNSNTNITRDKKKALINALFKLNVGDSFFIPAKYNEKTRCQTRYQKEKQIERYCEQNGIMHELEIRIVDNGLRVWRVA